MKAGSFAVGATNWCHLTKWVESPRRALETLQDEVFEVGAFKVGQHRPMTIEELLEYSGEDGTGTVLDLEGVSEQAQPMQASPAPDELLLELFGSTRPTRAQVEALAEELPEHVERWEALYFPVFDDAGPRWWCFAGASGDGRTCNTVPLPFDVDLDTGEPPPPRPRPILRIVK